MIIFCIYISSSSFGFLFVDADLCVRKLFLELYGFGESSPLIERIPLKITIL